MGRVLVFIHLTGVIVWIGGMFFAHFCLRPAAAATLTPPQRLPLLAAVLRRFFAVVGGALVLLWGSGIVLLGQVGTTIPWNIAAMVAVAATMTAILGAVFVRFTRLEACVASERWAEAGEAMDRIRKLVAVNLGLGFTNVAIAVVGSLIRL